MIYLLEFTLQGKIISYFPFCSDEHSLAECLSQEDSLYYLPSTIHYDISVLEGVFNVLYSFFTFDNNIRLYLKEVYLPEVDIDVADVNIPVTIRR